MVKLGFTGVCIHYFLVSASKHRLWILIRTNEVILETSRNLSKKNVYFSSENYNFYSVHSLCIVACHCAFVCHGEVKIEYRKHAYNLLGEPATCTAQVVNIR